MYQDLDRCKDGRETNVVKDLREVPTKYIAAITSGTKREFQTNPSKW
jgi:hypothetical protein